MEKVNFSLREKFPPISLNQASCCTYAEFVCFYLQVIVLESSSRFGGWLWSTRRSDGAVFEHGPRGIRPAGAMGHNTLNMVNSTIVVRNHIKTITVVVVTHK